MAFFILSRVSHRNLSQPSTNPDWVNSAILSEPRWWDSTRNSIWVGSSPKSSQNCIVPSMPMMSWSSSKRSRRWHEKGRKSGGRLVRVCHSQAPIREKWRMCSKCPHGIPKAYLCTFQRCCVAAERRRSPWIQTEPLCRLRQKMSWQQFLNSSLFFVAAVWLPFHCREEWDRMIDQ